VWPRLTLEPHAQGVNQHVDQLLEGEDSIVIVVGRKQITTRAQGFDLSGCQLELLSLRIERAICKLMSLEFGDDDADAGQSTDGFCTRNSVA
jgi:hypothetical protein